MRIHGRSTQTWVALATAASMLLSPVAPLVSAQAPKPAATAKPPAASTTGATAAATDGGWPRDYAMANGAPFRIFQPQIASWDGRQKLVAYYAVSYTPKDATKNALGSLKVEATTSVAVDDRLVNFTDVKIAESNFPSLSNDQQKELIGEIVKLVPQNGLVIGLDRVLARLDKSQIIPKNIADVKADPPPIFYSTTPAVLVNIDDDPIWSPIMGNDLKFAVNTNWDLFQDTQGKAYYLRYNQSWLTAPDVVKGPWKAAGKLPDGFKKLPDDNGNWKDVKAALPGVSLKSAELPKVFVSTKPAELILLKGMPSYVTVANTKLLWVNNSESDVFRLGRTGPVYFLVSGRWFSAPDFTGPWTFATQALPPEFKQIPLSHARSRVLASVPGTDQAAEAVLLAQIPQTATVNKKQLKAPEVAYDGGMPQFQPIEKTNLQRAVNTEKDIIKVGDLYYMCFQGVWFMGRSPTGPWEATGSVPGEIYTIPASSPSHNVTYVTVQEDNDDTAVYVAAAAYTGMMIAWGCVVWGSGYYYPPYVGYGGFYPMYHPYYPSYGYHASYNPWTGAYGRGVSAYGPYGGAGVGARYNPSTGTYARGAVAYGPGGRRSASAYNPRTGAVGATRQGSNVYGSWGSTAVARGDQWASTSRYTNRATGTTSRVTQGSGGGTAVTRNTPDLAVAASRGRAAATCMPAATGTYTRRNPAAAGRNQTAAAAGTTSTNLRRPPPPRIAPRRRAAGPTRQLWGSSIAIRPHARKGRSARTTTAAARDQADPAPAIDLRAAEVDARRRAAAADGVDSSGRSTRPPDDDPLLLTKGTRSDPRSRASATQKATSRWPSDPPLEPWRAPQTENA
jgi:hypothetical protein